MQKQVLSLFARESTRYKKYLAGIGLILPPTILMHQFLPPLILAGMLEQLAAGNYTKGDLWGSFGIPLLLFVVFRFTSATVTWRAIIVLMWKLEAHVVRAFNQRFFSHLVAQSASFHANNFGGSLVAMAVRFITAYRQLLSAVVMQFIPLILSYIFVIIILLPRAPLYILFLLGFTAIYIAITVAGTKKVRAKTAESAAAESTQTGALADSLTNIMAVKSFATGGSEQREFSKTLDHTQAKFFEMMRTTQSRELYFSTITATITCVSMVVAFASAVIFEANLATVFLIIEYTTVLTGRLWEFTIGTLRTYNRSVGDASDMARLLATEPEVQDPAQPEPVRIRRGAITFQNVNFTHTDASDAIFEKLTLSIPAGQKVGLVGHSGAGKTTFVKLLMRFADIDAGHIRIDGQNVSAIAQDDLRSHIAYVPQEPLLFHRSIRDNIAYGAVNATNTEVIAAAKKANAHEFIIKLPQGYSTLVGERGIKLSGGQRQRVAIARAILKDAPILVLDEATSALDSESEKAIQASLAELLHRRTAVVIAHRLSTIQKMDRIIVLKNGRIAEDGSHTELLNQNGVYATLWAHQSGGFIKE